MSQPGPGAGEEVNEQLARDYYKPSRLAPVFPQAAVGMPHENGDLGLPDDFDPATWKLTVVREAMKGQGDSFDDSSDPSDPSDDPSPDSGSSDNTGKKGKSSGTSPSDSPSTDDTPSPSDLTLTLADFIAKYPPPTQSGDPPDVRNRPDDLVGCVSLETPDGGCYVGLEMESALHPQTLLCYEMNGQPLTLAHGAPLRLVIPVKYGIKHIKRIGTIRFTNHRPADYWAEQGYDWYAGH